MEFDWKLNEKTLSSAAVDVLEQLFIRGPVWDGNVISKAGRGELVKAGLVFHSDGWASLTKEGVYVCSNWKYSDLKKNGGRIRWLEKLRAS